MIFTTDDCFTMEHFRLRQRMTSTTKIYCSRLYIKRFNECFLFSVVTIFIASLLFCSVLIIVVLLLAKKVDIIQVAAYFEAAKRQSTQQELPEPRMQLSCKHSKINSAPRNFPLSIPTQNVTKTF
jgi:hypothetical protein